MELVHGSSKKLFKNKMREESWKFGCQPAIPCKTKRGKVQGNLSHFLYSQEKYACIVEANESTRKRLEGTLHKDHEDHSEGKGIHSLKHYDLVVHSFCSHASSNENTRCESSRGQRIGKIERIPAWKLTKSQKQKRGDR